MEWVFNRTIYRNKKVVGVFVLRFSCAASLEQTNFMTQKSRSLLEEKLMLKVNLLSWVKQVEGMGLLSLQPTNRDQRKDGWFR
jgi:hypothetical protein